MPALAYLLLPVSGLIAYFKGPTPRARFHGLQSIAIALLWPIALYVCTYASSPGVTQGCFVVGALVWLGFMLATALGADPRLPLVGGALMKAARADPLEDPAARDEGP